MKSVKPAINSGSDKLVSFDIDHTLIDTFGAVVPAWRESMPIVADRLGISMTEACARMSEVIGKHLTQDYPWWLAHAFHPVWKGTVAQFVEQVESPFWDRQDRYMETHLRPYPEVIPTFTEFKKHSVKIVLVSDATYYITLARLCKTGLSQYVDGVYALDVKREPESVPSEEWLEFGDRRMRTIEKEYEKHFSLCRKLPESWAKPKPHGIKLACTDFSVAPGDVYHVGDSLGKDVVLAANAGLKGAMWLPDHAVATLPPEDREWINKKLAHPSVLWAVPSEVVPELQGSLGDLVGLVLGSGC